MKVVSLVLLGFLAVSPVFADEDLSLGTLNGFEKKTLESKKAAVVCRSGRSTRQPSGSRLVADTFKVESAATVLNQVLNSLEQEVTVTPFPTGTSSQGDIYSLCVILSLPR